MPPDIYCRAAARCERSNDGCTKVPLKEVEELGRRINRKDGRTNRT